MRHFIYPIIVLSILFVCCKYTNTRDTISFKDRLSDIEDSIKVMNNLLNPYQEVNYYIDDENILSFGTKEVGKIDSSSLDHLKKDPSKYTNKDIRIFAIILFLKRNDINSCFRHRTLDKIVYDYKPTKDDRFEDVRYIIFDDGQIDSNGFRNSHKILDKKNNLILIAPIERR
jgi:hypothetical protein